MPNLAPAQNAPVTAATITAAVGGLLAAFTGLTGEQIAAVTAAVGIAAQIVVQRYHTDPKAVGPEALDIHARPDGVPGPAGDPNDGGDHVQP